LAIATVGRQWASRQDFMAYRFKAGDLKSKSFRRIAGEQIARALTELAQDPVSPKGVHECRKVVKRLRALLRLVEPGLRAKDFKARYRAIGKVGDELAGARDAHVLEQTIAMLEARYGDSARLTLAPLKAHLGDAGHAANTYLTRQCIQRAEAALRKEDRKLAKLTLKADGFAALEGGLERTYRLAAKNLTAAYARPSDERFHELRKAVQWHWRHMALMSRAWPQYFAVRVAACRELGEALGDDHDLAVLMAEVQHLGEALAGDQATVILLAKTRQEELRRAAFALAERLFAEKPKAFTTRMKAYWTARTQLLAADTAMTGADIATVHDDIGPRAISSIPRLAVKSLKATRSQGDK
jgi:CHAD domain-containing protein